MAPGHRDGHLPSAEEAGEAGAEFLAGQTLDKIEKGAPTLYYLIMSIFMLVPTVLFLNLYDFAGGEWGFILFIFACFNIYYFARFCFAIARKIWAIFCAN